MDALLANAGRGLGKGFLDQNFDDVMRVVNTNITGTIYLIQKVGRDMRERKEGRIVITGSIAGFILAPTRPFTTPAKHSWIPSLLPCVLS